MGRNSRRIKDRACELAEGYEEARDEEFNMQFQDFITSLDPFNTVTVDDVQGFLDSFTFPEENDWAMDKALTELDDIGDQQYERWKDERDERARDEQD